MERMNISSCSFILFISTFHVILVSVTGSVKWKDCGTTVTVTDLRISGCNTEPCVFYEQKQYRLEFDAIPTKPTKTLPYTVKAAFFFQWTLLDGDACEELSNGTCPISDDGKSFTFFKDFSVDIPFPGLSTFHTTITAEMDDDFGRKLLCAELDVLINDASCDPNPLPKDEVLSGVVLPVEKPSFAQGFFNFFRS